MRQLFKGDDDQEYPPAAIPVAVHKAFKPSGLLGGTARYLIHGSAMTVNDRTLRLLRLVGDT